MWLAASDARNAITAAICGGSAIRPIGIVLASRFSNAGSGKFGFKFVRVAPGATAFTVIPLGPSSSAQHRVNASIAAFELLYAERSTIGKPATCDVTLIMRPLPCLTISRAARCFDDFPRPVEVRNQARVHLWSEERFGQPYPRLSRSEEALSLFAARTHAVGVRFGAGEGDHGRA